MTLCSICHRDLPIAVDETDPTTDELTVDARGVIRPGAYVCGACLDAAEDERVFAIAYSAPDGRRGVYMTVPTVGALVDAIASYPDPSHRLHINREYFRRDCARALWPNAGF